MNVVAPEWLQGFRWSNEDGSPREERPRSPTRTGEILTDGEGRTHRAKYLEWEWDRISLRPHYEWFVTFIVDLGQRVPLRIEIESDDLAPDQSPVEVSYEVATAD